MTMESKGYAAGPIEFDDEAGLFLGTVVGLCGVVHFAGGTADALARAFCDKRREGGRPRGRLPRLIAARFQKDAPT